MALDTYANLKTAVNSFLNVGTSDTSSVIDDIVTLGERRIWRELRVREMETSLSLTLTIATVAIPTGFLDLKVATYWDSSNYEWGLEIVDAAFLRSRFPNGFGTSRPVCIATEVDNFVVGPAPNEAYVLHGIYYKKTPAVSASATDNLIFQRNPDIYLMAALSQAEAILQRDSRTAIWEARYQAIRDALNMENTHGNDRVRATEF